MIDDDPRGRVLLDGVIVGLLVVGLARADGAFDRLGFVALLWMAVWFLLIDLPKVRL